MRMEGFRNGRAYSNGKFALTENPVEEARIAMVRTWEVVPGIGNNEFGAACGSGVRSQRVALQVMDSG